MEPRSLLEAAEQAAASGDYTAAEAKLREAAAIQEASLGSQHPDLANTLNNLGIVSEIVGKPEDAEQFFRRACAIAATSLEPSHPFVATSRKNLEDFCTARGKPVDVEVPAPAEAAPATVEEPAPRVESPEPAVTRTAIVEPPLLDTGVRRIVIPLAAVVLVAGAMAIWLRSGDPGPRPDPIGPAPAPAPAQESSPSKPAPAPVTSGTPNPPAVPKPAPSRSSGPASAGAVSVSEAALCRDLTAGWRCTPAVSPVEPSTLFFYTRVKSATDRIVEHRWYRGNRLAKSIDRSVRANPTEGYRTYSRTTVDAKGGRDWRVEVRTKEGVLLHEERFTVR
jgi:hypothetical protein